MSIPEVISSFVPTPYVQIVEQPFKSLRYRYLCERRRSVINGGTSTRDNKTPFAIEILGYEGRVMVLVSCVTKDKPYKPHPHNLVGPNCKNGICSVEADVTANNPIIKFPKLAVQCVKRQDRSESLKIREEKKIDPFKTGFAHRDDLKGVDLHYVRLAVQVILINDNRQRTAKLDPIVSDPIRNSKTFSNPLIYRLSHCNSYVEGKEEDIILLCTKIEKDDVQIRFFETNKSGDVVWYDFATFNTIYNQTAICFRPPKYHNQNITVPVKVSVELIRPSDGTASPPCDFEYLPSTAKPGALKHKRQQFDTFAQLVQNTLGLEYPQFEQPAKIPRLEDNSVLFGEASCASRKSSEDSTWIMDISSCSTRKTSEDSTWNIQDISENTNLNTVLFGESASCPSRQTSQDATWNIPEFIENKNLNDSFFGEPSTSAKTQDANWNILSENENLNVDSAGIYDFLQNNPVDLQPINISSGDLEMNDVQRLSGSIQGLMI